MKLRFPRRVFGWRGLAGLLLLMLALRLVWGWYLDRQLQAQLDEYRKRGEPVVPADIVYEPLPDSENAWKVIEQAMAALAPGVDSPAQSNLEYKNYPPYPPEWHKMAAASEAANAKVFVLMRQARALPRGRVGTRMQQPLITMLLPHLSPSRDLAQVAADGAISSHLAGDDQEAIDRLLDTWHLGQCLRDEPFLVSQLVVMGIHGVAMDRAQQIAPGLRFDARATTRPAQSQQVRALIDALLDESEIRPAIRRTLAVERLAWNEYCMTPAEGVWMIRPLATRTVMQWNRDVSLVIAAIECASLPPAERFLARGRKSFWNLPDTPCLCGEHGESVPRYSRWYSADSNDLSSVVSRQFRHLAERRATAISLACQLYRSDHGRWPDRLEDLVPAYLPAVPMDPYCDDDRPMLYDIHKGKRLDGADRPTVCYNTTAEDAGLSPEPMFGWQQPRQKSKSGIRQYRDISRFDPPPPATHPSTETINYDPTIPNGPYPQPPGQ